MDKLGLEQIKEQIKYRTEVLKLIVLLGVAVGGGSIGILLGKYSLVRIGLAGFGILVTLSLATGAWRQHRQIQQLIKRIAEAI